MPFAGDCPFRQHRYQSCDQLRLRDGFCKLKATYGNKPTSTSSSSKRRFLVKTTVKLVVVKKPNGSIRICANFLIDPNVALAQNRYPPPIPPDIFSRLNDGTCFDKLDLADAYLQIEIVPDSYELLTINTHRDLFQYTRLRFGVKAPPTLFQQTTNAMLSGIPGTAGHLDNIVVIVGRSPAELLARVCVQYSANKRQFFFGSSKFLEFVFYVTGRNPDLGNITAAQQIPAPKNLSQLTSYLRLRTPFLVSSEITAADIRRTTEQDPVLHQAFTCIQTCRSSIAIAGNLYQLFLRRASLSEVDTYFMIAGRVVNLSPLRPSLLRQFHAPHPVTSPIKSITPGFTYWQGTDSDIDDLVRHFSQSQQATKMPTR
ncbi:hypothetical protein SprV_1002913000 [Sparganum proliferum]